MIPESTNPHRDYPQMAADRGRIEPVPRRVRGYFNGILVFDTKAAHYVWEVAYYPQYYVPIEDVDTLCLVDEQHTHLRGLIAGFEVSVGPLEGGLEVAVLQRAPVGGSEAEDDEVQVQVVSFLGRSRPRSRA